VVGKLTERQHFQLALFLLGKNERRDEMLLQANRQEISGGQEASQGDGGAA